MPSSAAVGRSPARLPARRPWPTGPPRALCWPRPRSAASWDTSWCVLGHVTSPAFCSWLPPLFGDNRGGRGGGGLSLRVPALRACRWRLCGWMPWSGASHSVSALGRVPCCVLVILRRRRGPEALLCMGRNAHHPSASMVRPSRSYGHYPQCRWRLHARPCVPSPLCTPSL